MTIDLDDNEQGMVLHIFLTGLRHYEQTEIDALDEDYTIWKCSDCGNTGPSRGGIVHGSNCYFHRAYRVRAKLVTALVPSTRPDSPPS